MIETCLCRGHLTPGSQCVIQLHEHHAAAAPHSAERMTPAELGETTVIAVGGDPFASALDGERRQIRVGHDVAPCLALAAETVEDLPMALARRYQHTVRPRADRVSRLESALDRHRRVKNTLVRHHTQESAQDEIRHSVRRLGLHHLAQPLAVLVMARRTLCVRIHEDVNVDEEQLSPP